MSAPMLRVEGLSKSYGKLHVLDGVSFAVERGQVVALLGANGAGKTTSLNCILGVIGYRGVVEVDGIDVRRDGKAARRRIGYVPQSPALADGATCRDALRFIAEIKGVGRERVDAMLERVRLADQARTTVGHLSGGMRQRLALAAALLADPPLLLLDEPTDILNVESREEFHRLIGQLRDEGKTVVVSTHFLERIDELAGRALVLDRGALVFDGPLAGLGRHAHERRYIVSVNGNEAAFHAALRAAGVDAVSVEPAAARWDDVLRAATEEKTP